MTEAREIPIDHSRSDLYRAMTVFMGKVEEQAADYEETTGIKDPALEVELKKLYEAREIVFRHVFPDDIPF